MRVDVVIGTRPQYVKWAALESSFRRAFSIRLIDTGQHYDSQLSQVFLDEFGLAEPALNLKVGSASAGKQLARMITGLEKCWQAKRPDLVVVVGDTNSTLAGALAANKLGLPVGHVEAGIRSYNHQMPEENNRVLVDHLAALLWSPTRTAVSNLKKEGITRGVRWTGDVTYSLLLGLKRRLQSNKLRRKLDLKKKEYLMMTVHRPVNTDNFGRLAAIIRGATSISLPVVFPVHPRTRKLLATSKIKLPTNIIPLKPIGYIEMLTLVKQAKVVVTDSGGLLRESAWLKVPVAVVRDETEWPELVERGWNRLVGADENRIRRAVSGSYQTRSLAGLFGGPTNSRRVVSSIKRWFRKK